MTPSATLFFAAALLLSQSAFACVDQLPDMLKRAYPGARPGPGTAEGDRSFTLPGLPVRLVTVPEGVSCKVWTEKPELTLVAVTIEQLPKTALSSGGDLELFLIDSATGAIRHRLLEQGMMDSDAYKTTFGEFDTGDYSTAPERPLFGVRSDQVAETSGRRSEIEMFTLYAVNGGKIERVLELQTGSNNEVNVDVHEGASSKACGERKEESTVISRSPTLRNGLNDLVVDLAKSTATCMMVKGAEEWTTKKSTTTQHVVQFDGKTYRVPASLR